MQLSFNAGGSRHAPTKVKSILWLVLVGILAIISCMAFVSRAEAANVLIVTGTEATQVSASNRLNTLLVARGDTVTTAQTTPANLAPYSVIYDVRANSPARSNAELVQYLGFLNAGTSQVLFLLGENNGFGASGNASISDFIAQAGGGTVNVPTTSTFDAQTLTPSFNTPNAVGTTSFAAAGVLNTTGTGAFGATLAGGTTGSVLSFSPGTLANAPSGALVAVYDINFLSSPEQFGGVNNTAFSQNLINYVAAGAPPVVPPPVAAVPTMTEWAMILFGMMLAGGAALMLQRRRTAV